MPMPVFSRHRAPSISSASIHSNADLTVTDADDSIVLSDLVRTGEASRLRRRGAIRLEHGPGSHIAHPGADASGRAAIVGEQPRWSFGQIASLVAPVPWDIDDPEDRRTGGDTLPSSTENGRSTVDGEFSAYSYHLFCGGEKLPQEMESEPVAAFEPSILPLHTPSVPGPSQRPCRQRKSSNGCGALINTHASPRRRLGVWTAKSAATDVVVGMDPSYFDSAAVAKIVKSSCGCIREGVGCAICGNPLGTRYKPCAVAAESLFSAASTLRSRPRSSGGSLHPSGPRYWRQASSSSAHQSSTTSSANRSSMRSAVSSDVPCNIYTFFSHSVASSPSCSFPVPCTYQPIPATSASPSPINSEFIDDNGNGYAFAGAFTASPNSSETGEDPAGESGDGESVGYDRDGVPIDDPEISAELSSPEKYGNELMLAPER